MHPTEEETIRLLGETIVAEFIIEDLTVRESISRLRQLRDEAGIPADHLRITYGISGEFPESTLNARIADLRVRDASLAAIMKYMCGGTRLRYRIGAGVVEFQDARHLPPGPEETTLSPFSESSPHAD